MKEIILKVLNRHSDSQGNMSSDAFRETLAVEIAAVMKSKGCYTEYGDSEAKDNPLNIEMWKGHKEELSKEYLEDWTCDHCGKNTHEIDYDYLGNNRNHLHCELKLETSNQLELELN